MMPTPEDDRVPGAVLYLHDEQILVVALHSVIYLFDESDSMDSSLLKFYLGGHDDTQVTALGYSKTNGILVSGSVNGIVSFWMLYLNVHITALHVRESVKHICWVDPFSAVSVVTTSGKIWFWQINVPSLNMKITPGSVPPPVCLGVFDLHTHISCAVHYLGLPSSFEYPIASKLNLEADSDEPCLGEDFSDCRQKYLRDVRSGLSLLVLGDTVGKVYCLELNIFLVWKDLKPQPVHPCKLLKESRLMRGEHLAAHKGVLMALGITLNISKILEMVVETISLPKYSAKKICQFVARLHKGRVAGIVQP